jgi:hypothetical protein
MDMDKILVANEILRAARDLTSIEFKTKGEMEKYKAEHDIRPGTKLTLKKAPEGKAPAKKPVKIDKDTGWPDVKDHREIPPMGTPFIGPLTEGGFKNILKEVPFKKDLHKKQAVYVLDKGTGKFRSVKTNEDLSEQRIFIEPEKEHAKAMKSKKSSAKAAMSILALAREIVSE